MKKEKHFLVQ